MDVKCQMQTIRLIQKFILLDPRTNGDFPKLIKISILASVIRFDSVDDG